MTIQQLTYFRVLAETRHMGRAAEKLFLAQSSLSSAVAKLESELGVLLFERRGHHLVLTAEGTALLAHAETVLREVEETTEHMRRLAGRRETEIRLGCITPLLREYFPVMMRRFLQVPGNEGISFELSIENTPELVRRLKNGVYDLLLCSRSEDEDVIQFPILSEPILFLSPEGTPPPENWQDLAGIDLIGYEKGSVMDTVLTELAGRQGVRLRFTSRAPTEAAIASLVEYGFGCALVPWSESIPGAYRVARAPLPGGEYSRELYLTTLREEKPWGAAAKLIRFIMAEAEG